MNWMSFWTVVLALGLAVFVVTVVFVAIAGGRDLKALLGSLNRKEQARIDAMNDEQQP